jgi:hypothetical protein
LWFCGIVGLWAGLVGGGAGPCGSGGLRVGGGARIWVGGRYIKHILSSVSFSLSSFSSFFVFFLHFLSFLFISPLFHAFPCGHSSSTALTRLGCPQHVSADCSCSFSPIYKLLVRSHNHHHLRQTTTTAFIPFLFPAWNPPAFRNNSHDNSRTTTTTTTTTTAGQQ